MNSFDAHLQREENFLMACRYAYYCKNFSILTDTEYDRREKAFLNKFRLPTKMSECGSDHASDYTEYQRNLGDLLIKQGGLK